LFIAAVGMFLLYYEAAKEGAERVTLLNVVSTRSMIGMFVLALIELAAVPIFTFVFLIFYFESTWKPFLIELVGLAMFVHGLFLILGR
ncbi:MAG: hypothetical protein ACRCZF_09380, partial [Gemmataceae bacterium]